MFTGIIETMAELRGVESRGTNRVFHFFASIAPEFRVDESVAHNGVCLTVESVDAAACIYQVTAIEETLQRTNLGAWRAGSLVNLERSLQAGARIDGHFVQGHVDAVGSVVEIIPHDGSYEIWIEFPARYEDLIVEKGGVAVNGVSLTVAASDPQRHRFSVAVIPHTWRKTDVHSWQVGDGVNLEFDILGKYIKKLHANAAAPRGESAD